MPIYCCPLALFAYKYRKQEVVFRGLSLSMGKLNSVMSTEAHHLNWGKDLTTYPLAEDPNPPGTASFKPPDFPTCFAFSTRPSAGFNF